MKSPILSKILTVSFIITMFADAGLCQKEFTLNPFMNYINGFTNTGTSLMEIGLKADYFPSGPLRFGVRVPFLKSDRSTSQIDKSTDNFNLFIGNEIIIKEVPISANNNTWILAIEPSLECGMMRFRYYPDTTINSAVSDWKGNWAGELKALYYFSKRKSGSWHWGVYGRVRISQSYSASDEISVLNPSNNVVNDFIVESPRRAKVIAPAIGLQVYPGTKLPVAFSPVLYYYWNDNDNLKGFEKERLRAEEWIYFYPIDKKNLGIRIGFGAFQEYYTKGKSKDGVIAGGLVSIKVDTNIMKSIF